MDSENQPHGSKRRHNAIIGERVLLTGAAAVRQISNLSALAAGAAVLAFAQGSLYYRSYLMDLGAAWAQPMVTSASLLRAGGTLTAVVFLVATLLLALSASQQMSFRKLGLIQSFLSFSACACLVAPLLPQRWIGAGILTAASVGASILWAMSAGAAIAFITALISSDEGEGRGIRAFIGSLLSIPVGLFVPLIIAQQLAREDLDPERTQLPLVHVKDGGSQTWRLVFIEDKSALLVSLGGHGEDRQFKVVEGTSLESIERRGQVKPGPVRADEHAAH